MKSYTIQGVLIGISLGLAAGVGSYTFIYAKGYSYLTDDPAACANCHIMNEQYNGWLRSSHHAVAICNDCHTPQGFVSKYLTKASNGFWHSFAFTSGYFHEPIQITPRNFEIAEKACRKCHQEIVLAMGHPNEGDSRVSCVRCHGSVGHLQ